MSVHFPSTQFVRKLDDAAGKTYIYGGCAFMGCVAVGGVAAVAALASRGRWRPPAHFYSAWEDGMAVTGLTMIAGGFTGAVTDAVLKNRNSPFVKK